MEAHDAQGVSLQEFVDKICDTIWDTFSKLPPEEQDRRLDAFERTVDQVCSPNYSQPVVSSDVEEDRGGTTLKDTPAG